MALIIKIQGNLGMWGLQECLHGISEMLRFRDDQFVASTVENSADRQSFVLTPMWLLPLERSPSSWPPVPCQHGIYIAGTPNSRFWMRLGWFHGPISHSAESHFFPSLKRTPTPNLLWRIWILGKSSHYSSWKKETHSIYNICLCHTKRADTRCIDDKVAILWSYKKVHRKTHLDGKHPLGSLGTLKETHRSLFWTPWHFGTPDIPALADYLWISWSTKK